jgi:flagellar biosynthetic protein FliO
MADAVAPAAPALPWFGAVMAMLVVLALLAATLWILRRGLNRRFTRDSLMTIEDTLSLGDRRSLGVVGVEGRRLMIGIAPGQVQLVTELKRAGLAERVE